MLVKILLGRWRISRRNHFARSLKWIIQRGHLRWPVGICIHSKLLLVVVFLVHRCVIKVHAWQWERCHRMVSTNTLFIGADLRGLVLAVVGFKHTGHGCSISVCNLLRIVTVSLLVLLSRCGVARSWRDLRVVLAIYGHWGHSILVQVGIKVVVDWNLLMNRWQGAGSGGRRYRIVGLHVCREIGLIYFRDVALVSTIVFMDKYNSFLAPLPRLVAILSLKKIYNSSSWWFLNSFVI